MPRTAYALLAGINEYLAVTHLSGCVRDVPALAPAEAYPSMRAAIALSADEELRDAALETEARRRELSPAGSDLPFHHPHYWAPFILVGDWRLR